jgi:hypothetical protein
MSRGSDRRSHRPDSSLSVLLDLAGTKIGVGTHYWVKISAWVIEPDEARPHGIRYELTLHDAGNRRILGFDNAHAVKRPAVDLSNSRVPMITGTADRKTLECLTRM